MEIGDIVIFKNIVFDKGAKGRNHEIDHAFNRGRFCIYLGEIDDKMYFISVCDAGRWKYSKNLDCIIKPNKINGLNKLSVPNIRNLIEMKACFYPTVGYLTDKEMEKVFIAVKKYYTEVRNNNDHILLTLADEYLNKRNFKKYIDGDKKQKKK